MPSEDATFVSTRLAWQAVAEHVMAAARHAATGRIGLQVTPGGVGTAPFPSDAGPRTVAIDGSELVVADDAGVRRSALTTLADAAKLAGIEPGAPTEVFTPTTALAPDEPLLVDPHAAAELADWYALANHALSAVRAEMAHAEPSEIQLWPEHFDVAFSAAEVNWGASPGDADHPRPYLYVGPWAPPEPDGGFWDEPFGATLGASEITSVEDALDFYRQGRRHLDL